MEEGDLGVVTKETSILYGINPSYNISKMALEMLYPDLPNHPMIKSQCHSSRYAKPSNRFSVVLLSKSCLRIRRKPTKIQEIRKERKGRERRRPKCGFYMG